MTAFNSNPDFALILISAGILAICAEFLRPGMVVPGVAGSAAVLIGLTGLSHPTPLGFLFITLGFALLVMEALHPVRGVLRWAGALAMSFGCIRIPRIHPVVALLTSVPLALTLGYLFSAAVRARRNKTLSC